MPVAAGALVSRAAGGMKGKPSSKALSQGSLLNHLSEGSWDSTDQRLTQAAEQPVGSFLSGDTKT